MTTENILTSCLC